VIGSLREFTEYATLDEARLTAVEAGRTQ